MPKLWPGDNNTTVALDNQSRERVEGQIHGVESRAAWFRGAGEMRLEIEEAVEAANMADEMDEDWWRDWLYDAAREKLDRHEQQMLASQQDEREESEV